MNTKRICRLGRWTLLGLFVTIFWLSACQTQSGRPLATPPGTSLLSPTLLSPSTASPVPAGERPLPFRSISRSVSLGLFSKADLFGRSHR
jgi:hypothetical protein